MQIILYTPPCNKMKITQDLSATICNKTNVGYQTFSNKKNENSTNTIKNYQHMQKTLIPLGWLLTKSPMQLPLVWGKRICNIKLTYFSTAQLL